MKYTLKEFHEFLKAREKEYDEETPCVYRLGKVMALAEVLGAFEHAFKDQIKEEDNERPIR